jgi:hypothetical protein
MERESMAPRRVLVLYWHHDPSQPLRPAIAQHLHVLDSSPYRHQILYHDVGAGVPRLLRRLRFDAIVLHTTLLCYRWSTDFARVRNTLGWLASCDCLKIAMPQDEYDHAEVLDDWLADLRVSVICTNFAGNVRPLLYPRTHSQARFVQCLTGYIDERVAAARSKRWRPIAERPLDIVYRASQLPYWFGSHGQLKHEIAGAVAERAAALGLRCDISTRDDAVITGNQWYAFLGSGKAVIGCESGSSVLDRRGAMQARIRGILARHPDFAFAQVKRLLPAGWDDYRFFALGPRHLEAVVTRTCQVLIEGEYDGVLRPVRHYLPLRRDLANLDEVLHMVRDHALLEATATRAYQDIYESGKYTYGGLARTLDEELATASARPRLLPWRCAILQHWTWLLPRRILRRARVFAKRLRSRLFPRFPIPRPANPQKRVSV